MSLLVRLGLEQAHGELLARALVHGSAGPENYERLEFLGDRVLGLVMGAWLFEKFPSADEGELSRRLTAMVRESALVAVAARLGLGELITVGDGEKLKDSILADVVESVLGVVWLVKGFTGVDAVVRSAWGDMADAPDEKDAKSRLQELLQGQGLPTPRYEVLAEDGPAHDRVFTVKVMSALGEAEGQGRSKQVAGLAAAGVLMERIG